MRGNWNGKGEVLNAMRSVIAAEQAAEKAALKRSAEQREQHRQQFRPYPDLEQWQRMQKSQTCRAVAAPRQRAAAHRGRERRTADAARHPRLSA